jgi:polyisoprenoid-binding protein YceI
LKGRFAAPLAVFVALIAATDVSAQSSVHAAAAAAAPKTTRRFTVAPVGNEARYRVKEQLAGFDFPNDAIGVTKQITGQVVVDADGKVVKDASKIVVNVSDLKSDKTRRDNFIKTHALESEKFPQVELVPVTFLGLTEAIPAGQQKSFSMVGDLTVRGVTHPTTWQVIAHTQGNDIVGTASTMFTFKDFGMEQPKVPVVLSVADTIRLEYDFHFAPEVVR